MRILASLAGAGVLCLVQAALLPGCAAEPAEGSTSEAANTAAPLSVLKGREWARCWFDVAGDAAQLSCTSTKRAEGDPLATTVEVTAANTSPTAFVSASKKLDLEAGGTVVVGSFPRAAFPVIVLMKAELPRTAIEELGARKVLDVSNNLTVSRPEELGAVSPAIVKQPFDLWPTGLIDPSGQGGFAMRASYGVSIAPYASFLKETEMKLEPSFSGRDVAGKIRWWAAPASGGITVSMNGVASGEGSITGPGYYAVTASGLRPASSEEVARDFPAGAPAPSDADGGAAAAPDGAPTPSDPTPGCGGASEPRCAGGTCDPGHRYDSTSQKCLVCGGQGQTYCLNTSGGVTCNAGLRYDSNSRTCVL